MIRWLGEKWHCLAVKSLPALFRGIKSNHNVVLGEEILPSNQQQIIEQAKSTYSPLGKAFEKQIKTIEARRKTNKRNSKSRAS